MQDLAGVCFPINVGCPVDAGPIHMFSGSEELPLNKKEKQTPRKTAKTSLDVGLDQRPCYAIWPDSSFSAKSEVTARL